MVELVVPVSEAEVEFVVQIMDTDEHGKEIGWLTLETFERADQAKLYHDGLRHGVNDECHRLTGRQQSPVRTRWCRVILQEWPQKSLVAN